MAFKKDKFILTQDRGIRKWAYVDKDSTKGHNIADMDTSGFFNNALKDNDILSFTPMGLATHGYL